MSNDHIDWPERNGAPRRMAAHEFPEYEPAPSSDNPSDAELVNLVTNAVIGVARDAYHRGKQDASTPTFDPADRERSRSRSVRSVVARATKAALRFVPSLLPASLLPGSQHRGRGMPA